MPRRAASASAAAPTPAPAAPPGEPAPAEPVHQRVCARVRQLRQERGWTLEQLASLSGVSRSMLSQIERGEANPTLAVAWRIAQAFGLSLGDLVDLPAGRPRIEAIRADDARYLFRDDAQCRIRTLFPLHLEQEVEFYELTLKPGGSLESAPHVSGAREFLTVEKGAVRIASGSEAVELHKGDSAHYAADAPHAITNLARGESVAYLVVAYARPAGRRG